jgi:phosphatidylglycerophosphate synthase
VKTVVQLIVITAYILPFGQWADGPRLALLVVAVALTLYTCGQYAVRAIAWAKGSRAPAAAPHAGAAE